jgi:hypothetical protein
MCYTILRWHGWGLVSLPFGLLILSSAKETRMKLYKHSNGKTHFFPEVIPKGWEVMLNPNTFDVIWRRCK